MNRTAAPPTHDPASRRPDPNGSAAPVSCHSLARPTVCAITSGKGGVGKTNLAVNLGICLARGGQRVTLVDADLGLANADVLLGVHPRYNLTHYVRGERDLHEVIAPAPGGLSFLAGASGVRGADRLDAEQQRFLVERLATGREGFVILDCGAGISASVLEFALAADVVIVVTTPEPTALTDAYATVKTLWREGYGCSVRLLVNMVQSRAEARAAYGRIRAVAEKYMEFPIADAGYVLHDTHVELAVRQRIPFVLRYPKCSASACATAVAARFGCGHLQAPEQSGLIRRFVGLFT
jgi:flagellar biosynthesis protein FlhG